MDDVRVSFVLMNEKPIVKAEIEVLSRIDLCKLLSVRSFSARSTQEHKPGFFWMAQTGQHVPYESRLEMMILKTVDHERRVRAAISQPIVLHFVRGGKWRRHVPDFLFPLQECGALLLNVTASRRLEVERNRVNFEFCAAVSERLGWEYVTRTEPSPVYAANSTWLNGYRRPPWLLERYRDELLKRATSGLTIEEALRELQPEAFARPALFHLMWTREIDFDRNEILTDETKLSKGI